MERKCMIANHQAQCGYEIKTFKFIVLLTLAVAASAADHIVAAARGGS